MTIEDDGSSANNLKIEPQELKDKIDKGEDIFILDVRNTEEHKSWKISYDRYQDTLVIPVDTLLSSQSLKQIPKDKEIVTFCAHGQRSANAAKKLAELGYKVKTMEGGLADWSNVYDIALITQNSLVNIWQIRRVSKGCISYVIASTLDKKSTVIDATCDIGNPISKIISENGLQINHVIDTHIHADHLSGATRLARKYGSEVYTSSLEKYNIENIDDNNHISFKSIKESDRIPIGKGVVLEAIHTPGHTNGSISFKLEVNEDCNNTVTENSNSNIHKKNKNSLCYLFTGDTLFIDGVGRPDLHNKAEEYAHNLFNSYQKKIFILPDETIVLPSHYSGIFKHEKPIYDTIKSLKQKINLLSASENDFVKFINENIPPRPMNYDRIISINKKMMSCKMVEQKDLEFGPNSCGIRA